MTASGKAKSLFDDDDGDGEQSIKLNVNREFAARLKHNTDRAELHRLQEKLGDKSLQIQAKAARSVLAKLQRGPKGSIAKTKSSHYVDEEDEDDSSDDDDDEDDEEEDRGVMREKDEEAFLKVLAGVRKRDYSTTFPAEESSEHTEGTLEEDGEEEEEGGTAAGRPARKMLLKDVLAQQAKRVAQGKATYSSDDEEGEQRRAQPLTYNAEQAQLLQDFHKAVEAAEGDEEDEGGDFGSLRLKRKHVPQGPRPNDSIPKLLESAFGGAEAELDEGDRFLKSYLLNKGWVVADSADELSEDNYEEEEAQLEAEDRFEAQYNFRFQEPGGTSIVSYPRHVEGVRKPDERRKKARESRAERKAADRLQQELEVRRLKNLMSQEIRSKLDRIREAAGSSAVENSALLKALENEDFDADEYDKIMEKMYGRDYYEEEDDFAPDANDELAEGSEEQESDEEEEEEEVGEEAPPQHVLEVIDDRAPSAFDLARKKILGRSLDSEAEAGRRAASERAEVLRMMEQYNALEGEDRIGDLVCRFRYREVPATDYGLAPEDVLSLTDKELNQIVGMKRLATYRDDGGLVRPNFAKMKEFGIGRRGKQHDGGKAWQSQGKKKEKRPEKPRPPDKPVGDAGSRPADAIKENKKKRKHEEKLRSGAESQGRMHEDEATKAVGEQGAGSTKEKEHKRKRKRHWDGGVSGPRTADTGTEVPRSGATVEEMRVKKRLESYALPSLKAAHAEGIATKKKKKKAVEPQPPGNAAGEGPYLTKAQRKNLRRAQKRAEKRKQGKRAGSQD